MAERSLERKGPAGHRLLITGLNILLAILVYWLLGFILDDISNQPGPSFVALQQTYQDKTLLSQKNALSQEIAHLNHTIDTLKQQQVFIQSSINNYRDTMNQLLSLQKSSVQKGIALSAETQQNLVKVTQQYLDNQRRYQALNYAIADRYTDMQHLQSQADVIDTKLEAQTIQANQEYNTQLFRHNLKIAGLQLCVLLPLLIIVTFVYRRFRQSIYVPMIKAVGIAILIKILLVMHEHFPSRIFKYLLILTLIYLVAWALRAMLRMSIRPKINWLMKQYREAYQKMRCAICQYPITPGMLKLAPPYKQKKLQQIQLLPYVSTVEGYVCPSCGEPLFEKCEHCQHMRHSLLGYCDNCGFKKEIVS